MYSWAGQLYTALTVVYQEIKGISAGLTGFSGDKKRVYIFAHELHEWTRMFPNDKMATGSVARIVTNAMRGIYDDNRNNLRQLEVVFCERNRQRINFCPRIARMDTKARRYGNSDRVGRTNLH